MKFSAFALLRAASVSAVLAVAMPAYAADGVPLTTKTTISGSASETVDKTYIIGANTVRLRLTGGNTYVVVMKGSVDVTYADGSSLATVPEGTVLKIDGFLMPGSTVTANVVGGKAVVTLASAVELHVQSNAKAPQLKLMSAGSTVTLDAGKTATVMAPMTNFAAGQQVALKENQVGKAAAGQTELLAVGTSTGILVTTKKATAAIKGAGNDQLVLSQNAVLTINNGSLYVTADAVSLTGAHLQLMNSGGTIMVVHDGKSQPLPAGQAIGGPTPTTNTPPPPPPTHTTANLPPPPPAGSNGNLPPPPPAGTTPANTGGGETAAAEMTAEDKKILDDMDKWIAGK